MKPEKMTKTQLSKQNAVTVVIPTLLKNQKMLCNLIDKLVADVSVRELLLINNNNNEHFEYEHEKVRIILKKI